MDFKAMLLLFASVLLVSAEVINYKFSFLSLIHLYYFSTKVLNYWFICLGLV